MAHPFDTSVLATLAVAALVAPSIEAEAQPHWEARKIGNAEAPNTCLISRSAQKAVTSNYGELVLPVAKVLCYKGQVVLAFSFPGLTIEHGMDKVLAQLDKTEPFTLTMRPTGSIDSSWLWAPISLPGLTAGSLMTVQREDVFGTIEGMAQSAVLAVEIQAYGKPSIVARFDLSGFKEKLSAIKAVCPTDRGPFWGTISKTYTGRYRKQ